MVMAGFHGGVKTTTKQECAHMFIYCSQTQSSMWPEQLRNCLTLFLTLFCKYSKGLSFLENLISNSAKQQARVGITILEPTVTITHIQ